MIGAGVATYPKWKSQLPANLISGGKTAPQAALDGSRIAIAELKNQIQQLRAETVGAISKSAKNLKTGYITQADYDNNAARLRRAKAETTA